MPQLKESEGVLGNSSIRVSKTSETSPVNNDKTKTKIDVKDIDEYRKSFELQHHWELRREFLLTYADEFDEDRLICLSNVFINVECMGTTYPEDVMKLIKNLGTKIRDSDNTLIGQYSSFFEYGSQDVESVHESCRVVVNLRDRWSIFSKNKWLDGIKSVPPMGSWKLRISNLKRITQKIYDFASDLQSPQFRPTAVNPDVAKIAQVFEQTELNRLIQLILFCAISCEKKQHHIDRIHNLPTHIKQNIKEAIEELLVKNDETSLSPHKGSTNASTHDHRTNLNNSLNSLISSTRDTVDRQVDQRVDTSESSSNVFRNIQSQTSNINESADTVDDLRRRLSTALTINEEKAQAYYELERKFNQVQLEKEALQIEASRLSSEGIDRSKSSVRRASDIGRSNDNMREIGSLPKGEPNKLNDDVFKRNDSMEQNKRLQTEMNRLRGELMKVESERDDFRLRSNLLKDDLDKITAKNEQLKTKADQAKRLQDELDEYKHMLEKSQDHEGVIETHVKKNSIMKRELKSLEEKNASYIQQIVNLEAEKNQLSTALNQVDLFKRQLLELQVRLTKEVHRAEKAETDFSRLSEKYENTRRENERLFETAKNLRRNSGRDKSTTDIHCESAHEFVSSEPSGDNQPASQSSIMPMIELREKIVRLQSENRLLHDKLRSKRELEHSSLTSLLESANSRCTKLEAENRQARKKILMLETNVKEQLGSRGPVDSSNSDNTLLSLMNRVEELQRLLFQKEHEISDLEGKYARNLQKAKDLIKGLNNNQLANNQNSFQQSILGLGTSNCSSIASSSLDEVRLLKQQLKERENRVIELEREFYEFKKIKEIHERLILSAFYGMTTPIQWRNADKRLERTSLTSPSNTASSPVDAPNQPRKQQSNHSH